MLRSFTHIAATCAVIMLLLLMNRFHFHPHGQYQDTAGNYIDFRYSGTAFTNIGGGGGEVQLTYDRDGQRVTLHEPDGNPTLSLMPDGTLCCGPAGPLVFNRRQQNNSQQRSSP